MVISLYATGFGSVSLSYNLTLLLWEFLMVISLYAAGFGSVSFTYNLTLLALGVPYGHITLRYCIWKCLIII
jgi:hypothetical protein